MLDDLFIIFSSLVIPIAFVFFFRLISSFSCVLLFLFLWCFPFSFFIFYFLSLWLFSLVFRGYGGDEIVANFLTNISGGVVTSIIITMVAIFLLGFFLEVFEIIYVVVPIIGPAILMMGVDPLWFAIMIAINLQTSFLTPPFGFALFYLRGVVHSP